MSVRVLLACVLAALFVMPASTAAADTSRFRGVNWARLGDNFDTGPLVPQGLELTDDYATVRAKSDDMLDAFQAIGANTVRLPLNPASVGTGWWKSYTGAIDAAIARGFNVVLSYWEEGARGGKIADFTTWNRMWDTVVAKYLSSSRVYFDPMNEPHGYGGAEWMDIAARWLSDRPSVPRNRIIVSGIGFDWDVQPLCHDSRFDGTYLAFHHYYWDPDVQHLTTYDGWVADFKARLGDCASRTMLEEFGAPMDDALDYDDPAGTAREILYLRAYTDTVRALHMGSIYWAGIGGRYLASDDFGGYETLNVQRLGRTGTPLWTPNTTGLDRLRYAWGVGSGSGTTTLRNGTGACLDVPGASHDDVQVIAYPCHGGANQQWTRTAARQITVYDGEKCLDAYGGGTDEGTPVGTYPCHGGTNQQWTFFTDGTIRGVPSGRCLSVERVSGRLVLQDCGQDPGEQWTIS